MQRLKLILMVVVFCLVCVFPAQSASPRHERATTDLPDDITGYQVHVMYVLPSDGVDEELDINGAIATSVGAFQNWLANQTGGQKLRMDTFEGALDITFWQLSTDEAVLASQGAFIRDAIEAELKSSGFNNPEKLYAVYYGGNAMDTCGGGAWPPTLVGSVAAMYLKGTYTDPTVPPCASNPLARDENTPGYIDFAMLHEILHTLGIVPECAPHQTRSGHSSDDPSDLMYAGDEPWQPSILDIGRDDYYGHGKPDCLDLAKSVFMDPTAPDAVIPPGWLASEETGLPPAPMTYNTGLCSVDTRTPTTLIFSNVSTQPVDLYWVDYNCGEVYYSTLQPATTVSQSTFVGHPWRVRDSVTAELLVETVAVSTHLYTITIQ
ncbi:MAG: hypothetical protein HY862_20770 [Chloroflexi bacterium]|nr:hypothetical protein [Chloroflexota bacterium]